MVNCFLEVLLEVLSRFCSKFFALFVAEISFLRGCFHTCIHKCLRDRGRSNRHVNILTYVGQTYLKEKVCVITDWNWFQSLPWRICRHVGRRPRPDGLRQTTLITLDGSIINYTRTYRASSLWCQGWFRRMKNSRQVILLLLGLWL